MEIRFIPQEEIDRQKWNSCIHYAPNGHIFGYKWFLDQTAKRWDALVEGDYESVMPLPHRHHWLYGAALTQPPLVRELAVYSVRALSPARIAAFWDAVPAEYRQVDLAVEPRSRPADWKTSEQPTYFLSLREAYELIAEKYSPELLARARRVQEADLIPLSSVKPERLADLYRELHRPPREDDFVFHALQRIMYQVLHRGWGFASGIINREEQLLAAAFFIYSHGRALPLLALETPAGQAQDALVFLYDTFIRAHATRPLVLDFNNTPADLAKGFGALSQPVVRVQRDERWWKAF